MTLNRLTFAAVVQTSIRIADGQGLDSLTMRGVGEQLGVKAMALYRHISGREALLDAMVAAMMAELSVSMKHGDLFSTSGSASLEGTARDVRDLALAHPWLVPLMVLRPPPDPALSPPLSALACTESVLASLAHHGFDLAASLRTYRAFCAFLLGHLLLEVRTPVRGPVRRRLFDRGPPGSLTRYPQLVEAAGLTGVNYPAEFERCLSHFLSNLEAPGSPHLTFSTADHPPSCTMRPTPNPT